VKKPKGAVIHSSLKPLTIEKIMRSMLAVFAKQTMGRVRRRTSTKAFNHIGRAQLMHPVLMRHARVCSPSWLNTRRPPEYSHMPKFLAGKLLLDLDNDEGHVVVLRDAGGESVGRVHDAIYHLLRRKT